ncbi:MAG TPA: response regulator [Burkholderiales bacterium]|nr:response regulator [Burkholderiales bacterium]
MPGSKRILYVEPDSEARLVMKDLLASYELDIATGDAEARTLARKNSYDLYVLSGGPDTSGIELCAWLQRVDGRTPIVFCSSNASLKYQQAAISAGAVRFLVKPLDPTLLRSTVNLLLKLAELETARAKAAEQKAIMDALGERAELARRTAAAGAARADQARQHMVRAKAYRAFREAGGNRANFERLWPELADAIKSARE